MRPRLRPLLYTDKETQYVLIKKARGMYRWTSLYSRDRDSKNRLAYNESAYKKA